MNISKLTITKGRTIEKEKKWERTDYTIEITLAEKDDPETAKEMANLLIDAWLKEGEPVKPTSQKPFSSSKRGRTKAEREGWTKTCANPNCSKLISDSYTYCFLCNKKFNKD